MSRRAVSVSSRSLANSAQNTPAASRCSSRPDLTNNSLSTEQLQRALSPEQLQRALSPEQLHRVRQMLESHASVQPRNSNSVDHIQNSEEVDPVISIVQPTNYNSDNAIANRRHSLKSQISVNENMSNTLPEQQQPNTNFGDSELYNQPDIRNSNVQNRNLLSPHSQNHWWNAESNMTSSASSPDTEHTTDSGETWDVSSPTAELPTHNSHRDYHRHDTNILLYRMPICGYEIVEHSNRFTVFKIQVVHQPSSEHWFVFRRFTDFVRLNKKLRGEFPGLRFSLPPKRWLGDNFDPVFLENRTSSLQTFIDNVTGHAGVREAKSLREFFCLDDPPEPYDSLEECRAVCGSLEDACRVLQERVQERDAQNSVLKSQVCFLTSQQALLVKALRLECEIKENEDKYESSTETTESDNSTHQLNLALLKL